MLVIKQKDREIFNIAVTPETIARLASEGRGATMEVRVYNIVGPHGLKPGNVQLAFNDNERNFDIQRQSRLRKLAKV